MYMVYYEDSNCYRHSVLRTGDYWKAIAEMEWMNENDIDRRSFGIVKVPA